MVESPPKNDSIFIFPNIKHSLRVEITQIERLVDWLIEEQLHQVSTNSPSIMRAGIRLEVGEETSSLTH